MSMVDPSIDYLTEKVDSKYTLAHCLEGNCKRYHYL